MELKEPKEPKGLKGSETVSFLQGSDIVPWDVIVARFEKFKHMKKITVSELTNAYTREELEVIYESSEGGYIIDTYIQELINYLQVSKNFEVKEENANDTKIVDQYKSYVVHNDSASIKTDDDKYRLDFPFKRLCKILKLESHENLIGLYTSIWKGNISSIIETLEEEKNQDLLNEIYHHSGENYDVKLKVLKSLINLQHNLIVTQADIKLKSLENLTNEEKLDTLKMYYHYQGDSSTLRSYDGPSIYLYEYYLIRDERYFELLLELCSVYDLSCGVYIEDEENEDYLVTLCRIVILNCDFCIQTNHYDKLISVLNTLKNIKSPHYIIKSTISLGENILSLLKRNQEKDEIIIEKDRKIEEAFYSPFIGQGSRLALIPAIKKLDKRHKRNKSL